MTSGRARRRRTAARPRGIAPAARSTTRSIAQNRANTPPTPTTIATQHDERAGSRRLSRRKSSANGTRGRPQEHGRRARRREASDARPRRAMRSATEPSSLPAASRSCRLTVARSSSRWLGRRPAVLDVVQDAVEGVRAVLHVLDHAGPEAAADRPRPASGRRRRTVRCRPSAPSVRTTEASARIAFA